MSQDIKKNLEDLVTPLVRSMGLRLWGLEVPTSPRGGIFRVYIDSAEGVTIEQCAELSRHLNYILDVEDPIPGSYRLEVSSPWLERPFFYLEQLKDYLGRKVNLKLKEPVDNRKKYKGKLIKIENENLVLHTEGAEEISLAWSKVAKANLIHEY